MHVPLHPCVPLPLCAQHVTSVVAAWGALVVVTGSGRMYLLREVRGAEGGVGEAAGGDAERDWGGAGEGGGADDRCACVCLPGLGIVAGTGQGYTSCTLYPGKLWKWKRAIITPGPPSLSLFFQPPSSPQVELAAQLDTLFKRSLHKLALDVARAEGADAATIASIQQR